MSNINRNTLVVTVIMLLARVLSLGRDILLADRFGVSIENDVFIASQTIIAILSSFIMQSFISAYLPFSTDYYFGKSIEKNSYYAAIYVQATVLGLVQLIFCFFTLNLVVGLVAPGFSIDAKNMLGITILLQAPIILTQMINGINDTNLQIIGKYAFVQFSATIPYITSFIYLILFSKSSIYGLAISVTIGNIIMLLIKFPIIIKYFKPKFSRKIWFSDMKEMYIIVGLAIVTTAVRQVNAFVNQAVSSMLGAGSLTQLSYAMKIPATEASLVSLALSTILFAEMAKNISNNQEVKNEKLLFDALAFAVTLIVPFTIYTIIFRREIIMFLFERGAFSSSDTTTVSSLMIIFAVSMLAIAFQDLIIRAMFAYKIRVYSIVTSIILVIVNILLNLILFRVWGNYGIAFSYTISTIIIIPILIYYCNKKVIRIDLSKLLVISVQAFFASAVSGLFGLVIKETFRYFGFHYLPSVILSGLVSLIIFVGLSILTKNYIVISFVNLVRFKLFRKVQ